MLVIRDSICRICEDGTGFVGCVLVSPDLCGIDNVVRYKRTSVRHGNVIAKGESAVGIVNPLPCGRKLRFDFTCLCIVSYKVIRKDGSDHLAFVLRVSGRRPIQGGWLGAKSDRDGLFCLLSIGRITICACKSAFFSEGSRCHGNGHDGSECKAEYLFHLHMHSS